MAVTTITMAKMSQTAAMPRFSFSTANELVFGIGVHDEIGNYAASMGRRALVVTGGNRDRAAPALEQLADRGRFATVVCIRNEPSLADIERGLVEARGQGCDMVIGMGGGSALDAGKAIAALLSNGGQALDYLEVVGRGLPLRQRAAPMIAVPTTAGSGSEVTRNAVLSVPEQRVKVSMRSQLMLPHCALVDPTLTYSMPPSVTASTGLDALTHLIEAYVSNRANPLTDALCRDGIVRAAHSLAVAYRDGDNAQARSDMSMVGLMGGMALANAKLGAVHGFAGPLGGMFSAPHGCICGRLLPYVIESNVRALEDRTPGAPALRRYGEIASLLTGRHGATAGDAVDWIQALCTELIVPPMSSYGADLSDLDDVVAKARQASSMAGNPIELTAAELGAIFRNAL